MSEFKSALKPYDLWAALAADRGEDCLIINVGRDKEGSAVASLKHVSEQVDHYIHHAQAPTFAATKLYIVGSWNSPPPENVAEAESKRTAIEVSVPDHSRHSTSYMTIRPASTSADTMVQPGTYR
jgi:hypothetical protein